MMNFIRELSLQFADETLDCESPRGSHIFHSKPDYKSFKFLENSGASKCSKEVVTEAVDDPSGSCERRKIYIKKNVVDSFMPEIVGFFENNSYHFVEHVSGDIEAHCKERCERECCRLNCRRGVSEFTARGASGGASTSCRAEGRGSDTTGDMNAASEEGEAYRSAATMKPLRRRRRSVSSDSIGSSSSAGSFAFPTLNAEWDGTPPRMPGADRGYWHRHHEWRKSLLCCRF